VEIAPEIRRGEIALVTAGGHRVEGLDLGNGGGAASATRVITLPRTVRVWAYGRPTDLRKGYNGLVGIVEGELRSDVMAGDFYLFVNIRYKSSQAMVKGHTRLGVRARNRPRLGTTSQAGLPSHRTDENDQTAG
jgi:hypothetical protein